jgi:hypothetical protein
MTDLFDGVAGMLNDTFGAPVTVRNAAGVARTIQAIFRYEPVEIFGEDDATTPVNRPVLVVPKSIAGELAFGESVKVGEQRFTVVSSEPTQQSPAEDAFLRYYLEPENFIE